MKHGYVVLEADPHAGHKQGLCPETIRVLDPDTAKEVDEHTELSATQQRLLEIRTTNLLRLKDITRRKPWLYLHLGDQTHGSNFTDDAMEISAYKQTTIAAANMEPVLKLKPTCTRIAMSTPVHAHGGDSDKTLHHAYRQAHPKLDIRTGWHGDTDFKGFRIDHKHHGPRGGSREWTKTNSAWHYLRNEVEVELKAGRKPPSLYVRAHIHVDLMTTYAYQYHGQWIESRLITVPSMCGVGCYARKAIAALSSVTNGMVVVEIRDSQFYKSHWWTDTQDLRYMEVIE